MAPVPPANRGGKEGGRSGSAEGRVAALHSHDSLGGRPRAVCSRAEHAAGVKATLLMPHVAALMHTVPSSDFNACRNACRNTQRAQRAHRSSLSLASCSCTHAATAALIWSAVTSTPTPAASSNLATSIGSLPTCTAEGRHRHRQAAALNCGSLGAAQAHRAVPAWRQRRARRGAGNGHPREGQRRDRRSCAGHSSTHEASGCSQAPAPRALPRYSSAPSSCALLRMRSEVI